VAILGVPYLSLSNVSLSLLQVHLSEARVEHTLRKLGEMESLINDKLLLQEKGGSMKSRATRAATSTMEQVVTDEPQAQASISRGKTLDISGPVAPYPAQLKNYWYPVAFSGHIDEKTMVNAISLLRAAF